MGMGNEATAMRNMHFRAGRLAGRAVITVQGSEAGHFLHNILTADIERLADGQASYAALLSPQGKILSDMMVQRRGEGYLIDCAASQLDALLKHLTMYKLRARVEIAAAPGLAVNVSPEEIAGGFPDPRTPDIGWRSIGEALRDTADGYDAARIAAGLADSDADLGSNAFFPHEANLDQLGGVSFRKGCYVGQEVVSRMEHRGTARSRILPVTLDGEAPPKGTDIRDGEKQIGTLLSSSGREALALIRLDRLAEAAGPLTAGSVTLQVHKPTWVRYEVPA